MNTDERIEKLSEQVDSLISIMERMVALMEKWDRESPVL